MNSLQEIPCTVKPGVYLTVGGARTVCPSPTDGGLRPSGCQVVDIAVSNSSPDTSIDYISIHNHYTHTITVLCLRTTDSRHHKSPWQLCFKDHELMSNCHYERGGQDWVVLVGAESLIKMENVTDLRLILRQPSPHWRAFGVQDVRCYTTATDGGTSLTCSSEDLTNRMQRLGQSPVDKGELKLPYELNLLSYT